MRSNFIPHPTLPGDGRCRICDLPYSKFRDDEVAEHRRFHKRYLEACDGVGSPVPEHERQRLIHEGLELQRPGIPFKDRVRGAEMWLVGRHHEHLFEVLFYERPRLDLCEFFTRLEAKGSLKGNFDQDVLKELALRHSDRFIP